MIDPFSIGSLVLGVGTPLLKNLLPTLQEYLLKQENRRILHRVVWVGCVILLLLITGVAILASGYLLVSYKPGIAVVVALWSLFLGTTASLVLPGKVVVATFGGLVGVSLSEVSTAAGLISAVRKHVAALALELGGIAEPAGELQKTPDPFITWMIWLFILLVAVLCLPAFFEKDAKSAV